MYEKLNMSIYQIQNMVNVLDKAIANNSLTLQPSTSILSTNINQDQINKQQLAMLLHYKQQYLANDIVNIFNTKDLTDKGT